MKCPTCRRPVDEAAMECTRCGSDLEMIKNVQLRQSSLLSHGYAALRGKEIAQSKYYFEASIKLQGGCKDALKGLALVSLLEKNFVQALIYHQQYNTKK